MTAPHITEAQRLHDAALKHRCPFCHSDPGQACRANRGRGRELDHSHSRRIALTKPAETRTPAQPRKALCCQCGHQRTVSANHFTSMKDPNAPYGDQGKSLGWRSTRTLKCEACGERTRHAVLRGDDEKHPDWDEFHQRIALGAPDTRRYPLDDESIKRLRREYRQLYPRNPFLHHRYWINEAKTAWDEGHKTVTAVCGEQVTIDFDPHQPKNWSQKKREPGGIVADQLSDTEYEDPDTGLWWVDMDCVDCCRVANRLYWDKQRERLKWFLAHFALKTDAIPDLDVGVLVEHLDKLYNDAKGRGTQ